MTITMKIDTAELRRLEAEATPGPWDVSGLTVYDTCMDSVASTHSAADAALIVAMRNALPELLKVLDALRQIEGAACDGIEDGGYREALIEIRYAARKALPPHGGVDVG